jgi:hypothetical protein
MTVTHVRPTTAQVAEPEAAERSTTELDLAYPAGWYAPVNPNAAATQAKALAWLEERGVVHDEITRKTFAKLDVGRYGGSPFPFARAEEAELVTRFLSMWIFYDDLLEENDDGLENSLEDALMGRGEPRREDSVHLGCWRELGRITADAMSPAWSARHARRFAEWARSVRPENLVATELRARGVMPPSADHLARRSVNIGVYPTLHFLEYQDGFELPATLLADADYAALTLAVAELVAIVNDLFGFTKDRDARWVNYVSCIAAERGVSLAGAFAIAVADHDERVARIREIEARLLASQHASVELARWLYGVHVMISGFTRWHAGAPRYRARHVMEDGTMLQLRIADDAEMFDESLAA